MKIPLPPIFGIQITRFMVMEVVAAVLVILVMIPVVRHIAGKHVSHGKFVNMFEAMLLFIRDDVARPAIGGHRRRAKPRGCARRIAQGPAAWPAGQAQEVAEAVLYLCSPNAGAVTGTTIAVAGGEV